MNLAQISYEPLTNVLINLLQILMNFLQLSYELLTIFELHVNLSNFLHTFY
jgi:hypothetical protein